MASLIEHDDTDELSDGVQAAQTFASRNIVGLCEEIALSEDERTSSAPLFQQLRALCGFASDRHLMAMAIINAAARAKVLATPRC